MRTVWRDDGTWYRTRRNRRVYTHVYSTAWGRGQNPTTEYRVRNTLPGDGPESFPTSAYEAVRTVHTYLTEGTFYQLLASASFTAHAGEE